MDQNNQTQKSNIKIYIIIAFMISIIILLTILYQKLSVDLQSKSNNILEYNHYQTWDVWKVWDTWF